MEWWEHKCGLVASLHSLVEDEHGSRIFEISAILQFQASSVVQKRFLIAEKSYCSANNLH